jgi:hypothetical protein
MTTSTKDLIEELMQAHNGHGCESESTFCEAAHRLRELESQVEALRKDSARLDWIIDNASSAGGGNGFTLKVFIPADCECVRTAIDTAIAKDTQLTALSEMVKLSEELGLYEHPLSN